MNLKEHGSKIQEQWRRNKINKINTINKINFQYILCFETTF